jgi:transcriptional regulator with XRE-family HTH domain
MSKTLKTTVRKNTKYLEFVSWMSQPSVMRQPKTLQDFAKKIGIHKDTLTNWKSSKSFWSDVKTEKTFLMQEWLGTAIAALFRKIMKYGNACDVKLLFQLAGEWEYGKRTPEEESMRAESKLTETKIEEMAKKLKKWKEINLR